MTNWTQIPSDQVIATTAEQLTAHGFTTTVLASKAEVVSELGKLIPTGSTVMTGSSTTLKETGVMDALEKDQFGWRNLQAEVWAENDESKRNTLRRQAEASQYFLASANAVTQDGKIVAVDATGSRVGAFPFAAEHLILVIGAQKITPDLPAAMERVREHVYALENKRAQAAYGAPTTYGKWVIMEREVNPNRINVLLVKEALGF